MKAKARPKKKAPGFSPAETKRVAKQWRFMALGSWVFVVLFTAIVSRDLVSPHRGPAILSIEEVLLPCASLILAVGSTIMWWVFRRRSGRPG